MGLVATSSTRTRSPVVRASARHIGVDSGEILKERRREAQRVRTHPPAVGYEAATEK
jgi:hypothetical protein